MKEELNGVYKRLSSSCILHTEQQGDQESFSDCHTHSGVKMLTETDGFKLPNFRTDRWFKKNRRPKPEVSDPSRTDGRPPAETPPEKPKVVIPTFEDLIQTNSLCEASELLIQREERLFVDLKPSDALTRHEEEVRKLAADRRVLEDLVLQTLRLSLGQAEDSSRVLASAVRAVVQEEDQDRRWTGRLQTPPDWRPRGWKKLHDLTLLSLVEERLDNPPTPPADNVKQSSLQADVHLMGRQLKEDLLYVVRVLKSSYPPEMNICQFYAGMYHQSLSARLKKITDFGLEEKDSTFLLRWVNEFYPQMLQKPELSGDIDVGSLGKLLPEELLQPLEEQYLSSQQEKLKTYVGRVLDEAKQKWTRGEKPNQEDGCYVSPVSYDIIQLIKGMVTSAEEILGDLHKAQNITCHLNDSMHRFKSFQNDVILQNKANSVAIVKANLGCIQQFRDVLEKRRQLFMEDVQKDCLQVLTDMKLSAHAFLLKPAHDTLKPQYRKLGTCDWLNKPLFDNLLVSIEKELESLQGSVESCHQKLVGQFHQEVTAEYVKRLLKGQVKLKNKELQLKAFTTVKENAENLHELFSSMGSEENWLTEILTKIAEVLKLQDLPAIQMQIASLGMEYPDLSEKHVLALLRLKTNLSKVDRKTITDILLDTREQQQSDGAARTFFTHVQVK